MISTLTSSTRLGRTTLIAMAAVAALAAGLFLWAAGGTAGAHNASAPLTAVASQQTGDVVPGGAYVHVTYKSKHNADWYQFVMKDANGNTVHGWDVFPVLPKSHVRLIGDSAANGGYAIPCGSGAANFEVHAWRHGANGTSVHIAQVGNQQAPVRPCDSLHVDFETEGGGADVRVDAAGTHGADWYRYELRTTDGVRMHLFDIKARDTVHYVTVGGPGSSYRLPCDGGPGQRTSRSGDRKAGFSVTAWRHGEGNTSVKIRDVGQQLSPVHACLPPEPETGTPTETVSGPYVAMVVADANYEMPDAPHPYWNVNAVSVANHNGPLNYSEAIRSNSNIIKRIAASERSAGDLIAWGSHQGYAVRANLSDMVPEGTDLSDPAVCNSFRVAYAAQLIYVDNEDNYRIDTTKEPEDNHEALVVGCGGGASEAKAEEARIMVPVDPIDRVSNTVSSFDHWTVEFQQVDGNGNGVGPKYRSGDYRPQLEGNKMVVQDKWWHAVAVPYDEIGRNFGYADCYGLRFKYEWLAHSGDISNATRVRSDAPPLRVENCWRAPLAKTEPALAFPVSIRWDKVAGADGYIVDVAQEEASAALAPVVKAPLTTTQTFMACLPSGDDNMMRVEVRPYAIPLGGSMADRVEWPGTKFELPCSAQ